MVQKEKVFLICLSLDLIGIKLILLAQYGMLVILILNLIFHLLILFKQIPYDSVWGGRIKSDKEMYRLEILAIFLTTFFLFIVLVRLGMININIPESYLKYTFWFLTVFFAFNTLGNYRSKNKMEQRVFTPITLLLSIFSLIIALSY